MPRRLRALPPAVLIVLALLALVLLVLVLAQLLLPGIAADRIRSRVDRYGHTVSVNVSAWPAIELLWGDADHVTVRASSVSLSASRAAALVHEGSGVSRLDFSAQRVRIGPLALTDATLSKRGEQLVARARASREAVRRALPAGFTLKLLRSGGGQVEVLAAGALFGIGASVRALALAQEGVLVAHPVGLLLEGFTLRLFSDPHIAIEGVAAAEEAGGYRLALTGRLR